MRISSIFSVFCILLVAADNSFLARAEEPGQCVSNAETGECINPDAAVEENVAEESTPEEPEGVATEPAEDAVVEEVTVEEEVVEEAAEEVQEAAAAETTADETVSGATEESEALPVGEETAPVDPADEITTEEAVTVDPVEETTTEETEPATEEALEETVTATDEEVEEEETPGCPSRKHVIKCAAKYLDTNRNNYLEREELQSAIDKLPWLSRGILSILGSIDKMMAKCDIDKDGAIGIDFDMTHNAKTCLATCFKRRAFRSAFFPECQV